MRSRKPSKANNAAAKVLSVGGIPDLAIAAEDITLSDPDVKAFETVDLIVTVRNIGSEPVVNIPIQIYDNDALLTELTLEGVNAASSNKAIITTGFTADTHNIRVMVDPAHSIAAEKNIANNTATATFKIDAEPDCPADIAIESITTTPALPLSTEPTTVTVRIVNLGGTDITDAFAVALSVDRNRQRYDHCSETRKGPSRYSRVRKSHSGRRRKNTAGGGRWRQCYYRRRQS